MTDYFADTIADLLARGEAAAPAIGAPGRPWLDYAALRAQAANTVAALNGMGIGRQDRVAIVLPSGPEMAALFVCAAGACTAAPLNPAYKPDEFAFYLDDLAAAALIVQAGADTLSRAVAQARGIAIIELTPGEAAGSFTLAATLSGKHAGAPKQPGAAAAEDTALVLHTSGTTSRPKIVPLSHRNVTASACHIGECLVLTPGDVCLNIMPLFHIHGLIAGVLASLAAGAAVSCAPGFNAFAFFAQFDEVRPSWFTAVPTMHQALLTRAGRHASSIEAGRLRLIRSSSASLPPAVMTALEAAFHVPVIESYGMTEAAHQMASNPLPPRARHPGSVGLAAGPEVAIMGPGGALLPAGSAGEIVIRGRNVTAGYENNPNANKAAFQDGWFRTGDEGVLDQAGYLRLTGRLKEIIIRGGEKISPLEVDNVLMDHPDVAQALTFALPHDKLGEEVAACIVLRDGAAEDDHAIRDFASTRLAPFKVPRRIVFLQEIPKGATGKLMRIGLAAKLGLAP